MRFSWVLVFLTAPAWAFMWGAAVAGGFAMPMGDYGDVAAAAAVADGRALVCLTPNINLAAGVGYRFGHRVREDFGLAGVKYDVLPILVGGDYRFDFLPCMPYAGGGFAGVVANAHVPHLNEFTGEVEVVRRKSFKAGGYADGGMEYYLGENFGVDARGRFTYAVGGDVAFFNDKVVDVDNYIAMEALIGFFFYP